MTTRELDVYQDESGEWRWRVWGANGSDIVADSGEAYVHRTDAYEMGVSLNPDVPVRGESDPDWEQEC